MMLLKTALNMPANLEDSTVATGLGSPEKNPCTMDTLSLTKEARIYTGEKTSSLTSGCGKTGQPLVKK